MMALAKKCDRCGKLYEHYPTGRKSQTNSIRKCMVLPDGSLYYSEAIHDLCPECMEEFDKFLTAKLFEGVNNEKI